MMSPTDVFLSTAGVLDAELTERLKQRLQATQSSPSSPSAPELQLRAPL
jgi:hypothetical protein